jgi:hypothetical protein
MHWRRPRWVASENFRPLSGTSENVVGCLCELPTGRADVPLINGSGGADGWRALKMAALHSWQRLAIGRHYLLDSRGFFAGHRIRIPTGAHHVLPKIGRFNYNGRRFYYGH